MPTCSAVAAPIEWPTTWALSIFSASISAMTSSRAMSWLYLAPIFRHVGRRIAALAVGDAAVRPGEMPHLRLPGAVVAGIFMDEDDGRALRPPLRNTTGCHLARRYAASRTPNADLQLFAHKRKRSKVAIGRSIANCLRIRPNGSCPDKREVVAAKTAPENSGGVVNVWTISTPRYRSGRGVCLRPRLLCRARRRSRSPSSKSPA